MRLIDADHLIQVVCSATILSDGFKEAFRKLVAGESTVDRPTRSQFKRMAVQLGYEPVIRCKKCVHWQKFNDDSRRDGMCEALLNFHGAERNMTNEDFFCAYGERRADFVDDNKIGERRTDEQ
jgi:hypothetical protein|nr:MAG TPA: hypothetical protein [Caudoviricetes sp.]